MKISSNYNLINFRGDEGSNSSSGLSSSLTTTAVNAATGAAVGVVVGGARCLIPISKKEVAKTLSDAFLIYKKSEFPIAGEVSALSSKLHTVINNNGWLQFIKNVGDMSDDVFAAQSRNLAGHVGIATAKKSLFSKEVVEEVITKSQIIEAAKKKLIGKKPAMVGAEALEELTQNLAQKSSELFETAKTFAIENPKDELVEVAKRIAKKTRNASFMKSSIRIGIMIAMLLGIFNAVKSAKGSKENNS